MLNPFVDAFNVVSLTKAINKLPHVPHRVSELGIFNGQGIADRSVTWEEQDGTIALVKSTSRGAQGQRFGRSTDARRMGMLAVPHFELFDGLTADDLQARREFGTEDTVEDYNTTVADKLQRLKQDMSLTWEWLRLNALKGILLDADGSVIYNYYTEMNVTAPSISISFTAGAVDFKKVCAQITRHMQDALGGTPWKGIMALCGNQFWDNFIAHATIVNAYDKYVNNAENIAFMRGLQIAETPGGRGFMFGDIIWENYRGSVGGTQLLDTTQAIFFPLGTTDVFEEYYAPADYIEAVNTKGLPLYAKSKLTDWDKGVELAVQSNILPICHRPKCLLTATGTNMVVSPSITNAAS